MVHGRIARTGQIKEGKAELDAGLEALHTWLDNLWKTRDGQFWDTRSVLRKAIVEIQGRLKTDRVDERVKRLALQFEEEGRHVLDDKQIDRQPLLDS